jgi:PncC family amidohydrolase
MTIMNEVYMNTPLELQLGRLLKERGWTLATAESCTGGLLGHRITEVPGSSDYFMGGIIAYSYETKQKFLRVKPATLETHGAVSEETAIEMADGVRETFEVDVGIAVTGIAGPASDLSDKPVGLTWIAISTPKGTWAESYHWEKDRSGNKIQSAQAALELALRIIRETV